MFVCSSILLHKLVFDLKGTSRCASQFYTPKFLSVLRIYAVKASKFSRIILHLYPALTVVTGYKVSRRFNYTLNSDMCMFPLGAIVNPGWCSYGMPCGSKLFETNCDMYVVICRRNM